MAIRDMLIRELRQLCSAGEFSGPEPKWHGVVAYFRELRNRMESW